MARKNKSAIVEVPRREIRRVIKYRRTSKAREHMTTLVTQDSELDRLIEYKRWDCVGNFVDSGISAYGRKSFRPDLEAAIQKIERGEADAIVVFRIDRLTRSLSEFTDIWDRLKACGGSIVSKSEDFDTSTIQGEMMLSLIVGFAQMESAAKRERAIPMHNHQKEIGAVGPGPRPYGYEKVTSKETKNSRGNKGAGAILTVIPSEAEMIREAAAWVLSDEKGKGGLIGFINHYQPDSSRANVKMTYRGLRHVLTNATTAGLREWNDAPDGTGFQKGNWDAILDRETWEALRAKLLDPSRKTYESNERTGLLSGVARCHCGAGLTSRNWVHKESREVTRRYQCANVGTCYNSIDQTAANGVVLEKLFEVVPQSVWDAWQTAGMGWDSSLVETLESRLAAIDAEYAEGKLPHNRWMNLTTNIQKQIDSAQSQEPLDIPRASVLADSWEKFDNDDKARVLRQAFPHGITIVKQNGSRDPHTRVLFPEGELA